jgi:predicted SnoaL-like aldol condensation-catalyzing enzyme
MSNSSPERNKAIVLEAFETLFNKRDYVGAERFWSPNYIQHSAHIPPGAKDCLISSAQRRSRCIMRTSSSSQKAITS